jgi:hypothetical protein
VGGTLYKHAISVEESIFFPFEWRPKMRASIPVQVNLVVFLDRKHIDAIRFKSLGRAFLNIFGV